MTEKRKRDEVERAAQPGEPAHEEEPQAVSEHAGMPGDGAGRREDVSGSGVYAASGPMPKGDAEPHGMASWGQGERGAEGYEDHGGSELSPEGIGGATSGPTGEPTGDESEIRDLRE